MSGEIPPELYNLTELRMLYLNNNRLSGEISPGLGNLSLLEKLSVANNELCIPQTAEFEAQAAGISSHDLVNVPYCE